MSFFNQSQNTQQQTGGGLFGMPSNNNTGLFAQSSPSIHTNPPPRPSGFGGFGQPVSQNSHHTGGLFGQPSNNTSGGLFGNAAGQNTSSTTSDPPIARPSNGLFGNTNPSNTNASGFVTPAAPSNNVGGLFGNTNQSNSSASGFGRSTAFNNNVGGLFGNTANNQPPPTQDLFGNVRNSSSTSLFGARTPCHPSDSSTQSASIFGKPAPTNNKPHSPFDGLSHANTTVDGLFGNSRPQKSSAGSSSSTVPGLFGSQNTSNTSPNLFNSLSSQTYQSPFNNQRPSYPNNGVCQLVTSTSSPFDNTLNIASSTGQVVRNCCVCGSCKAVYDYKHGSGTSEGFRPYEEKDTYGPRCIYQSNLFMPLYQRYSNEELRLVDYNQGRRFGQPLAEFLAQEAAPSNTASLFDPKCGCQLILASKDIEIQRLKTKIIELEAAISQGKETAPRKPQTASGDLPVNSTAAANTAGVINFPTKKAIAAQLDSQTQRIQDIESQLEKVTALLEQSGISSTRSVTAAIPTSGQNIVTESSDKTPVDGKSSSTNVIFTPGSSTDTTPAHEESTEDFVNIPAQADSDSVTLAASEQVNASSSTLNTPTPRATHAEAEHAFQTWTLPADRNLSQHAQEVWWHLRNYHYSAKASEYNGRSATEISSSLRMNLRQVFKACDELIDAGLATTTVSEDTFTVLGGTKPSEST